MGKIDKEFNKALELAEKGVLIPMEDLHQHCDSEKERDTIRLKYSFLARIARSNVKREKDEVKGLKLTKAFTIRMLSTGLTIALIGTLSSICYLALTGKDIPDILIGIVSTLIGYLVGIVTGILGINNGKNINQIDDSSSNIN